MNPRRTLGLVEGLMPLWSRVIRISLGLFVLLHALAHTELLLRGEVQTPPATFLDTVTVVAFMIAVIALFVGGLGITGSRVFAPPAVRLVFTGLAASLVALTAGWNDSSWWGLALDATVLGALVACRRMGVLLPPERPARHGARRALGVTVEVLACGLAAYVALGTVLWPWHRHWGTTAAERLRALPGDQTPRHVDYELMHAVSIEAPPDEVWRWLVQLGQDRAGFYSYDWLERLFLADVHNVYEIRPEWQVRQAGDFIPAAPPNYVGGAFGPKVGWTVSQVEPGRALVLNKWGAFVLEPDGPGRTRFLIRSSIGAPDAPVWGAALTFALFELPHFIMERKMMLTIKACAERQTGGGATTLTRRTR